MSFEPQPESQAERVVRHQATITPPEDRLSLMDVWRTVVKQRFVILTVTVIAFGLAITYAFRTKPVFESVSRIEINPRNSPNVGLQGFNEEGHTPDTAAGLGTEILVLQSDSVILQTAESLNLTSRLPAGGQNAAKLQDAQPSGGLTPRQRRALIEIIKGGLRVQIVNGTLMVDIRYRNQDPQLATEVVNKFVDTYIDQDLQSKFERTQHVSVWLEKQLEDLKQEASDAQRRLAEYQREHNIVGTDETSNLTMQNLQRISADMEAAEATGS